MSATKPQGEEIAIEAEGARLAGRFFAAEGPARAHLVLHGATGVPQRFYRAFATWAAARGIGVLTYDYRDFGASSRGPLRDSRATMADWGMLDQSAAEAALARLAPEGPLWTLGHSLGGLTFAFRDHDPRVEQIVTVGSGMVHVRDHPPSYLPAALAFWYLLGPIGTAIAGYLPGEKLFLGADLPAGVYWQWRRWCTDRRFFRPDIGTALPEPDFGGQAAHLRMVSMADDQMVPPRAVWRYADAFPEGRIERRLLEPEHLGLKALGHINVFAAGNAAAWPAILGLNE